MESKSPLVIVTRALVVYVDSLSLYYDRKLISFVVGPEILTESTLGQKVQQEKGESFG